MTASMKEIPSMARIASLLRAECADVQHHMLGLSTDARERGMLPDAEKIRRLNDRACELHEAASALEAFEKSVADALGSGERGSDLIEVARNAHAAEIENASAQTLLTQLHAEVLELQAALTEAR